MAGSGRSARSTSAGGLVVHLTSGLAALCSVWVLGKRKGLDTEDLHPHNLTLTALGTGLLWFGWLGLERRASAGPTRRGVAAFVATILAGSAAIVSWSALEYFQKRKVTMLGACTGAIAGLVAVTPGGRLCHSDRGTRPRGFGMPVLLWGDRGQGQAGLRRLARRLRGSRCRRPGRRAGFGRAGDARPHRRRRRSL